MRGPLLRHRRAIGERAARGQPSARAGRAPWRWALPHAGHQSANRRPRFVSFCVRAGVAPCRTHARAIGEAQKAGLGQATRVPARVRAARQDAGSRGHAGHCLCIGVLGRAECLSALGEEEREQGAPAPTFSQPFRVGSVRARGVVSCLQATPCRLSESPSSSVSASR